MILPRNPRSAAVLALAALTLLIPVPGVLLAQAARPNPILDVTLLAEPVEGLNTRFEIQLALSRPVAELELILRGAGGDTEIEHFRVADRKPGSPGSKAPPGSLVDHELAENDLRFVLVRALALGDYLVEVVADGETMHSGVRDTREFPNILVQRARYLESGGPPVWSGLVKAGSGEANPPHVRLLDAEPVSPGGEVAGTVHRLSFELTGDGDPAGYVFLVFDDRGFWIQESPKPTVSWEVSALEPGREYYWLARARTSTILLRFSELPSFRLSSP